jgi:photosynthetic reaction center H subunit
MPTGAITGYIDVAQLTLYGFWLFFAGLIFYLRREDKREGYPLVSDRPDHMIVEGLPRTPAPKTFLLPHGGMTTAPRAEKIAPVKAERLLPWFGAPFEPTGDPMIDGVGAAAFADRADTPELTYEGEARFVPLRVATEFSVEPEDPDPRGMTVIAADHVEVGVVRDLWIDRTEPHIAFFEIDAAVPDGRRTVLMPGPFASTITGGEVRQIRVEAITAAQFADVPATRDPERITALEEDRIAAYFAGGYRYATPARLGPVL